MVHPNATKLDPPVDPNGDHLLGNPEAELTLVEYGSYSCVSCHSAHEVLPTSASFRRADALCLPPSSARERRPRTAAAELAERVFEKREILVGHDALMKRGPRDPRISTRWRGGLAYVAGGASGQTPRLRGRARRPKRAPKRVTFTPLFSSRPPLRGPWDEHLADACSARAVSRSSRSLSFALWAPSAGFFSVDVRLAASWRLVQRRPSCLVGHSVWRSGGWHGIFFRS